MLKYLQYSLIVEDKLKQLILFGTKLYVYLIELPLILVLVGAIQYNSESEALLGLYPLIIFSILAILFVAVYFFNAVIITNARIKQFGLFSSRDSALINKDKTLVLTYLPRRRMRVELFMLQKKSALEWVSDEDFKPIEANIFRERVIGSDSTAKRVLKFFGATKEQIQSLLSEESATAETEDIIFSTDVYGERKRILIKFIKTI